MPPQVSKSEYFRSTSPKLAALVALSIASSTFAASALLSSDNSSVIQPETSRAATQQDGVGYRVTGIRLGYQSDHPSLPDLKPLLERTVSLIPIEGGYIGAQNAENADGVVQVAIGEIGLGGAETLYGSALAVIIQTVRDEMESRYGFLGHLVTPSPDEIAFRTTQEDLRGPGDHPLTILIWPATVGDVRTVARGDRIAEQPGEHDDPNVNHPAHERQRERMTIQAGDLLTKESVDDEVYELNRHPGRRVDVSIAPSTQQGEVVLDYLISEPKQWSAYASVSNTGTKSTDEWQERFGFIHRQLTGQDDILQLDYITAGFDESHAVLGSYAFDLGPDFRARVHGRWNQYTASDVGLGFASFEGEGYEFGAEISTNIWSEGPRFLDVFGGIRYEHISVDNRVLLISGEEDFLLPFGGLRYQKSTPLHTAFAEVRFETNLASAAGTSELAIGTLGRPNVENEFTTVKGQIMHSFFLEPIFDPKGFSGERGVDDMTLAHELVFSVRGQSSLGSRLAPNYQMVAGGASSVRGYKESVAVGDNAIIGSVEYRYHLGKATPVTTETTTLFGSTFRNARSRPYGGADWDLILSGFVDIGRVSVQDAFFFENAETLVGVGVGVEAQLKRNLTLRLNYGMAMTKIGSGASTVSDVGDSRLHFKATVVF
jgi:hemolysin activation/secretion protein